MIKNNEFNKACTKLIVLSVLLLAMGVIPTQTIHAQEPTLKAAFAHYPPWKIIDKDGSISGVDADILNKIGEKMGCKIEFVACPWKRCISLLENGQADLATNFAINAERQKFSQYITPPYVIQQTVIYVREGDKNNISSYSDLTNFLIGTVKGAHVFERFHQDPQMRYVEVAHQKQLLEMLKNKRVDAIIGIDTNLKYQIKKEEYSSLFEKAAYLPPDASPTHFAMSKLSPHLNLAPKIQQALQEMVKSGEIFDIIERHTDY